MAIYARQAIETKFLGPTNSRDRRVKATAQAGTVTVDWDDALDIAENHAAAAATLAAKYGWGGDINIGANAHGDGYVFVFCEPGTRVKRKK